MSMYLFATCLVLGCIYWGHGGVFLWLPCLKYPLLQSGKHLSLQMHRTESCSSSFGIRTGAFLLWVAPNQSGEPLDWGPRQLAVVPRSRRWTLEVWCIRLEVWWFFLHDREQPVPWEGLMHIDLRFGVLGYWSLLLVPLVQWFDAHGPKV